MTTQNKTKNKQNTVCTVHMCTYNACVHVCGCGLQSLKMLLNVTTKVQCKQ